MKIPAYANIGRLMNGIYTALPQPRERNLASLISVYESNYFRLMRLVPELDKFEGTVVSRVAGTLDLYLTVLECQKYTTTVTLTYQFPEEDQIVLEPNAKISICHDVRTAEVLSHCRRKRSRAIYHWGYQRMPDLHQKWEINRFFQKWLGFCHLQGHLFLKFAAWQYPR